MDRPYSVLFISRRNSARSLMAEALINHLSKGRFRAYSAGVDPVSEVDPVALKVIEAAGFPTDGLHPKHWSIFTGRDAPVLDFIFTLSATASREEFPEWPGKPASSYWRYPDPTKAEGQAWEREREYGRTLSALERQMRLFMQLPFDSLDRIALGKHLDEMGAHQKATAH